MRFRQSARRRPSNHRGCVHTACSGPSPNAHRAAGCSADFSRRKEIPGPGARGGSLSDVPHSRILRLTRRICIDADHQCSQDRLLNQVMEYRVSRRFKALWGQAQRIREANKRHAKRARNGSESQVPGVGRSAPRRDRSREGGFYPHPSCHCSGHHERHRGSNSHPRIYL